MNELRNEFLQKWDEFKDAVFKKLPSNVQCDDPVLILAQNADCIFKLKKDQVSIILLLGTIHKLIVNPNCADVAVSATLTKEIFDIIEQIIVSIR